jgi:hypothetical protein
MTDLDTVWYDPENDTLVIIYIPITFTVSIEIGNEARELPRPLNHKDISNVYDRLVVGGLICLGTL